MSVLITADALLARREASAAAPDLAALDAHLGRDVEQVLAHPLYLPESKALLSRWGAHCRDDEAELLFDPFAPHAHRCSRCGRAWDTEQAHRWWVYWYQLWLAERVLMMALRAGSGGDAAAEARALETLAGLAGRYESWPNADNVLGPSRPFFSTYLESVWVLQLASAAALLEELGRLPRELAADLRGKLFAPSAALIADYPEGRSNRQTWNAAALFALGRVLGDAGMQERAARGPDGILATLESGLLADGLWYEGENYHWFALRGIAWGAELLRTAGVVDLWKDGGGAGARFREAFRAPVLTALPDFTFPARRDSKFGVSLRQRRMAELWELALARTSAAQGDGAEPSPAFYASLLAHVYDPALSADGTESWREITDVERAEPPRGVRRTSLGWKGWLYMPPSLPPSEPEAWRPGTAHLETTGLAIIRRDEGRTYVSLDYGEPGGGHGHPDRLNLTAVLKGVPLLLDFGTGSYVAPSLAWYRTTLAHNAPLVDGLSQLPARGVAVAFDDAGDCGWVCAALLTDTAFEAAALQRTVVVTPQYVLDVVQMQSESGERQLALPWHGLGELVADEHGLVILRPEGPVRIHLSARQPFQVLVQRAPGPPGLSGEVDQELGYAVVIGTGEDVTLAACLDPDGVVADIDCVEDDFVVHLKDGTAQVHRATDEGWYIEFERGDPARLGGLREVPEPPPPPARPEPPFRVAVSEPIVLDRADQFRRAEVPYEGPARFAARARVTVEDETVRVAVDVTAPEPWFRPGDLPDPEWENENPDIHSDGVQVYVEFEGFYGWLVVPDAENHRRVRVAAVRGTDGEPEMIAGGTWELTPTGYTMAFDIVFPDAPAGEIGFDLYVNRKPEEAERRTGQLVWSGARAERLYLAGDRALPGPLPRLALA